MAKPTDTIARNARRGLELREKYERGGTAVGVARASDLSNKRDIPEKTLNRIISFLERHEKNYRPGKKESDGGPTRGTIAYLLWGGKPALDWAKKERDKIERRRKKD